MSMNLNGFEALEDRVLLAGNVFVNVDGLGNMTVTGDGLGNNIRIDDSSDGGGADGNYFMTSGDANTVLRLNGVVVTEVLLTGNIRFDLRGGNDTLTVVEEAFVAGGLNQLALGANVAINMGAGSDNITVAGIGGIILGNVSIDLGAGNDVLVTSDTVNALDVSNLTVVGGAGRDIITLDGVSAGFASGGAGNVSVNGGAGSDDITVTNASIAGTTRLTLGGGSDILEIGAGSTFTGAVAVTGSAGRDVIGIDGAQFNGNFSLRGNGGRDTVLIGGGATFNGVNDIRGGGGRDELIADGTQTGLFRNQIRSFRVTGV